MSFGTLDRSAPPLFKHGPSAISRLAVYVALALFLMVADARFQLTDPVRQAVSTALYPVQWTLMKSWRLASGGADYFQSLETAQHELDAAREQMTKIVVQAHDAKELAEENAQLRKLLDLRGRLHVPSLAAEVVYEMPDSYTRRVVIDQGQAAGVQPGSPVMDERGVLGQVTRVLPFSSEVTLLVDRDQAIPVLVARTGVRSVAYGDASNLRADGMELRFMPGNADIEEGDLLTTSGVDGVYPPGLPVAQVVEVERRSDTAFSRIDCKPVARMQGGRHVVVLTPLDALRENTYPELARSSAVPAATAAPNAAATVLPAGATFAPVTQEGAPR